MSFSSLPFIKPHFHDNTGTGAAAESYVIKAYDSSTQDPVALYRDHLGSAVYPVDGIEMNTRGEPDGEGIYLDDALTYKIEFREPTVNGTEGAVIWTVNGVKGVNSVQAVDGDGRILISGTDNLKGFAIEKIVPFDDEVEITIGDQGLNEKLVIRVKNDKVGLDDSDDPDYLTNKLKAGDNINIQEVDDGGVRKLEISAAAMYTTLQGAYDASPTGKPIDLEENEPVNYKPIATSVGPNIIINQFKDPADDITIRDGVQGRYIGVSSTYLKSYSDGVNSDHQVSYQRYEWPQLSDQSLVTDPNYKYARNRANQNEAICRAEVKEDDFSTYAFNRAQNDTADNWIYANENDGQGLDVTGEMYRRVSPNSASDTSEINTAQKLMQLNTDTCFESGRGGDTGDSDRSVWERAVTKSSGYSESSEIIRDNGGGIWSTKYERRLGLNDNGYSEYVNGALLAPGGMKPFERVINFNPLQGIGVNAEATVTYDRYSEQYYRKSGWLNGNGATVNAVYSDEIYPGASSSFALQTIATTNPAQAYTSMIIGNFGNGSSIDISGGATTSYTPVIRLRASGVEKVNIGVNQSKFSQMLYTPEVDKGVNTDSTTSINWNDGNTQEVEMDGTTATISFSTNAPKGATVRIIIQASQVVDITWPTSVKWVGGVKPSISGLHAVTMAVTEVNGVLEYIGTATGAAS